MSEHHVVPLKIYFLIFFALMIGTALTVAAAFVNMGFMNTPVALVIALIKASLVIMFFMHVKYNILMSFIQVDLRNKALQNSCGGAF